MAEVLKIDDLHHTEARAALALFMADHGLTVEAVFVPFSQSRNKDAGCPSLNWRVTLKRKGRAVLESDYSAGAAHCPGYKVTRPPVNFEAKRYRSRDGVTRFATAAEALQQYRNEVTRAECESGVPMRLNIWAVNTPGNVFERTPKAAPIMPDPVDVFGSLAQDANVLDSGGFEDWAANYGYDTDSRKAEAIFRVCVDQSLKLAAAIGHDGLSTARTLANQL